MKFLATLFTASVLLFPSLGHAQTNLVVNGDFETGDLTGWTEMHFNGASFWNVYTGIALPPLPPPPTGTFAVVADQNGPSSQILFQDVTLPTSGNIQLSLIYYYFNHAGGFVTQPTLDPTVTPNQQARIDIMDPTAVDPFSVAPADVLANLFQTNPGDPNSLGYTPLTFDLTPFAGQTIRLRFAVVTTIDVFNFAVDDVQILADDILPPECFEGKVVKNRFPSQSEIIHKLTWWPSPSDNIFGYHIYRDGKLIAFVPKKGPFEYEDHNRKKNKSNTYELTAFNNDSETEPLTVTLP